MHPLAFGTRANFKINRIVPGAIGEAMRNAAAGPEARGITGLKYRLPRVLLQDQLALEQIDELVLLFVPVP